MAQYVRPYHGALHSYVVVEIKSKREYFDASVTIQKSHCGRRTGVFGPEIRADRRRINIKTSDTSVCFFFNYDEVLWMNKKRRKKEKKKKTTLEEHVNGPKQQAYLVANRSTCVHYIHFV